MEHAVTTIANDAVTKRQFERFLPNGKLPPRWMGTVKTLNDVVLLPIIVQDQSGVLRYSVLIEISFYISCVLHHIACFLFFTK